MHRHQRRITLSSSPTSMAGARTAWSWSCTSRSTPHSKRKCGTTITNGNSAKWCVLLFSSLRLFSALSALLTPPQPAEHAELANQLRAKLSEELQHAELSSAELKRLLPGTDDFTKRQSSYNESLDMIKVRPTRCRHRIFPAKSTFYFLFFAVLSQLSVDVQSSQQGPAGRSPALVCPQGDRRAEPIPLLRLFQGLPVPARVVLYAAAHAPH